MGLHGRITDEENSVGFARFVHHDAWLVGTRLVELSNERHHPVAIGIVFGEQRVFHAALAGSSAENDDWLARKFRVVAKHDSSSYAVKALHCASGTDYYDETGYGRDNFAISGGAVPLRVNGSLIGAVGVSGLREEDDHALVIEVLRTYSAQLPGA
jgi:uncharacterized protein (UPF0303 family)